MIVNILKFKICVCVGLYENRSQVTNKFKTDNFESDLHKVFYFLVGISQ